MYFLNYQYYYVILVDIFFNFVLSAIVIIVILLLEYGAKDPRVQKEWSQVKLCWTVFHISINTVRMSGTPVVCNQTKYIIYTYLQQIRSSCTTRNERYLITQCLMLRNVRYELKQGDEESE